MLFFPLIFFSCIGISSEIWINEDGSGKIQLEYRMPNLFIERMKNSDNQQSLKIVVEEGIDIPECLSRYNIRAQIKDMKTLTVSDYKVSKNNTDTYIFCEIEFSSTKELRSLEFMPEVDIQYYNDGAVVFEQAISPDSSLNNEDREVMQLYKDYENTYIVHAPKKVTSYNAGLLSEDRKTVVLKHSLLFPGRNNCGEDIELQNTFIVEW